MSRYDLIIFDLDGTLLDTTEGIVASVRRTIETNGLEALPADKLQKFIGPPVQVSFMDAYGINTEEAQALANDFRAIYSRPEYLFQVVPYSGIYEVLERLRNHGKRLAVATYKREDYARILLEQYQFDRYMDWIFGGDNENRLSKADIIEKCVCAAGNTLPDRIAMVGDTAGDAKGAKERGVDFIGVLYGFGFATEAERAQFPCALWAANMEELAKELLA